MPAKDSDGSWFVRTHATAIGDLVADAFYWYANRGDGSCGADIAMLSNAVPVHAYDGTESDTRQFADYLKSFADGTLASAKSPLHERGYAEALAYENGIFGAQRIDIRETDPEAPRGSSENPWAGGDSVMAWTNGVGGLVIEGTGAMSNFINAASVPWAAVAGEMTEVSVGKDVTRIGVNALAGFAADVPVHGLTATVLNDSIIAPAGAISGAEPEKVAIIDGKAYLGVSVYTNSEVKARGSSYAEATEDREGEGWGVATNGVIEVPAEDKQGFFYLMSKPSAPLDRP